MFEYVVSLIATISLDNFIKEGYSLIDRTDL